MTPFKKKISAVTLSVNTVEGATEDLELTFPKTGGIRLSGANKGIHEAEENYDITCQTAGDVTTFTADNGEYVKLIQETDDWSIDLYNASNERVKSIKGSQIVFFYTIMLRLSRPKSQVMLAKTKSLQVSESDLTVLFKTEVL